MWAPSECTMAVFGGKEAAISGGVTPGGAPRLLDQVRARLRLKHYSLRTEQTYLYWIRRYIRAWLPRHPAELDGGGGGVVSYRPGYARPGRGQYPEPGVGCPALPLPGLGIGLPWMENVAGAKQDQHA